MKRNLTLVLGAVLLVAIGRMSLFTVDRTEFVYVTQLGRHVATYDGSKDDEAGLHLRWPWPIQALTSIDRRLQVLDLPAAELVTEDESESGTIDKTLAVDAYVVWHVPDAAAAERFIQAVGSIERAREILRDRLHNRLGAEVAKKKFTDLFSAEKGKVEREREKLREQLQRGESERDGIEIVDVRVRRLNYPGQVRQAIFTRISRERNRKAETYLSRGRRKAADIRSESDAKISVEKAQAQARNDEKRGKADADAERILNRAVSLDPDYYAELKRREIGDMALEGNKKVKVWSTQLYRMLFPTLGEGDKK